MAAHLVRFTIQARGLRLAMGLAVTALGVVLTWQVIASGHNPDGLQAVPVSPFPTLWLLCKIGLLGLLAAMLAGFGLDARCRRESGQAATAGRRAVLVAGVSAWLWLGGEAAYLGDSGMRILWQLIQGEFVSLVLLGGCWLFAKRGGMVLIHAGIGLLMFGEWFVSWYAVEERLIIQEGQAANYALDIRETELAVVDPAYSATEEDVVAIRGHCPLLVRLVLLPRRLPSAKRPDPRQPVRFRGCPGVIGQLALRDHQPLLDRIPGDKRLPEHQQPDAGVDQHDAAASGEQQQAAEQQHQGHEFTLDQLPKDDHAQSRPGTPTRRPSQSQAARPATSSNALPCSRRPTRFRSASRIIHTNPPQEPAKQQGQTGLANKPRVGHSKAGTACSPSGLWPAAITCHVKTAPRAVTANPVARRIPRACTVNRTACRPAS